MLQCQCRKLCHVIMFYVHSGHSYLVSNHVLCWMSIVPCHHVLCRMSVVPCQHVCVDRVERKERARLINVKFSGKGSDPKVGRCTRTPYSALMRHTVHSCTTQCTHASHSALMQHTVHSCTTQCTHATHSALMHHTMHSYTTLYSYTTLLVIVHPYTSIKALIKTLND